MPTPEATADCIFCTILRGDAPATFLHEDDLVVAFMDIRLIARGR
jgi:diadenosine tetraphosphate (Ap4A) HIT family hydrolase